MVVYLGGLEKQEEQRFLNTLQPLLEKFVN